MKSPMMKHGEGKSFCLVQFEWVEAKNGAASDREGRAVFDKVLRVYIQAPGSKNQIASHEIERHFWASKGEKPRKRVNQQLRDRYREQLAAWERQESGVLLELQGTPLRELHGLDVAQVAELKDLQIHTVEQLAALSDAHLFMGARKWREMAQAYLEQADQQAPLSRFAAENEGLRGEVDQLKAQVEALTAAAAAAETQKKRGPGRPRKDAEAT